MTILCIQTQNQNVIEQYKVEKYYQNDVLFHPMIALNDHKVIQSKMTIHLYWRVYLEHYKDTSFGNTKGEIVISTILLFRTAFFLPENKCKLVLHSIIVLLVSLIMS